jgi:serine/threonine protein kinase
MKEINQEKIKNEINVNIQEDIPSLDILVKNKIISSLTAEKVKIFKSIIENKYLKISEREKTKKKLWNKITKYLLNVTSLTEQEKEEIKLVAQLKENQIYKLTRKKLTMNDFEILKPIGRGGFGEVNICRYKSSGKIYAMKKILFERLKYKNGLLHVQTEKNILSLNNDNIWITQLRYSFIENKYLYLIMDYCPGGDFMNYLIQKEYLQEDEARFYIAEIILCVHSLHKINCIHRDLKPDNILIGEDGHLKLSDFGLSFISSDKLFPLTENEKCINNNEIPKKRKILSNSLNDKCNNDDEVKNEEISKSYSPNINLNKQIMAYSRVGSPDYVAPEVIKNEGYGEEIDWWSVGAIFYEMLIGYPPFFSESPQITLTKITNFEHYLSIPKERVISVEAKKLIFDFLSEASKRLGSNGIEEIKNHCFFKDFDWDNIRLMKPPFIPELSSPDDTRYFKNKNISSIRFTNRLKRTNAFFNREEKNNNNEILVSKFYFQYNRDAVEIEKNIIKEIMDLIHKEIEFKMANKNVFDEGSSEAKSSSESLNNLSNPISSRTYSKDKLNYNIFSPQSSSSFSHKTVFSARKKDLKILPIRNLMNQKKSEEKQIKRKSKDIGNTRIKLIKGPGRFYSIRINKK